VALLFICMCESVRRPFGSLYIRDVLECRTDMEHAWIEPSHWRPLLGSVICLASPEDFGTCFRDATKDALNPWLAISKQDNGGASPLPTNRDMKHARTELNHLWPLLGLVICLASPEAFGTCLGNATGDALSLCPMISKHDNKQVSPLPTNSQDFCS
jgi:hypothetical protein